MVSTLFLIFMEEIHESNNNLNWLNDEKIGIAAVKKGAQDYLVKGQVDGRLLKRSIRYSIERKKAEEKIQNLAKIVESSNDAIITKSLDGIITSWNKGAEQIYGYSAEEIIGKPVTTLIPFSRNEEMEKLVEMIKQGEKIKHYETSRLKKDGMIIDVSISLSPTFNASGDLVAISTIGRDITESKKAKEFLANIEIARKKEIHHRIKNNLQVISSLLDLQAENFNNREYIKDSEVLEAFRVSRDRVISIAFIHEELYEGREPDILNFSFYLEKLVKSLFQTYRLGNAKTNLKMDLEENVFFDMDIAVPLGIIINELVSNSLKHAFPGRDKGIIQIKLFSEQAGNELSNKKYLTGKGTRYTIMVSDDGVGIPEKIDFENSETLGLQLVNILVDQLDGEIELKKDNGTEFTMSFSAEEKENY